MLFLHTAVKVPYERFFASTQTYKWHGMKHISFVITRSSARGWIITEV